MSGLRAWHLLLVGIASMRLLPTTARAQVQGPFFETVLANELPSRTINCVAKDALGTLWVGTPNGVARVIGDQVRVWQQRAGDTSSLVSNMVLSVDASDPKRVWIGTARGLCALDPVTGAVRRFPCTLPGLERARANTVRQVVRTDARSLWVATATDLLHFDMQSARWSIPGPRRRDQPGFRIPAVPGAMAYDPHRRILWIGTKVGLYMLDSAALNAPLEPRLMDVYELSSIVMSVALDDNGSLWVHDAERLSLTIIDPDERTVRQEHLPQNTDPYSVCAAMVVDASGAAWLGTSDERLYHRSPESTTWQTIAHGLDAPWSLGNTMVHALLCDATGTVWIGTEDGLVRSVATMPDQRLLCAWRDPITVNSMEYDGKRLYVATHGAGLVILNARSPDQRDTIRYAERKRKYDPSAPALLSDLVTDALPLSSGGLVGTGIGVMRWDEGERTYSYDPGLVPEESDLYRRRVNDIVRDPQKGAWVLSMYHGLWFLNGDGEAPRHIFRNKLGNGRELAPPSALIADRNSGVWCGTESGQLVHFDRNGNSHDATALRDSASLASINALCISSDGLLWAGFDDGSYQAVAPGNQDPQPKRSWSVVDRILDMCSSGDAVWILSEGGLWQASSSLREPTRRSLPPYWGKPLAMVSDGSEGLFLAFSRAIIHLDGSQDAVRATAPVPVIAGILMNENHLPADAHHARVVAENDQRALRILFSATGVARPELVRFSYRIDPSSPWTDLDHARSLDLPDLWEGRYTIEIAALDANGKPMVPSAIVDLTIRPPWYRSAPAIVLAAIAFLLLLFMGARWLIQRRLSIERERAEREQELLRERIRIAQDLHDDLGSSLALIGMESELARMDVQEPAAREALLKVSDGAREVTDNMRRIVWALGSGQDTLADLVAYIRSSAAELLDRAGMGLETRIDLSTPEVKLSVDQRRHLLLVSKEMLLNAVKHSGAQEVELDIVQNSGRLRIVVKDDGKGFDPASLDGTGTGTVSMRKRASSLGGRLLIRSIPGHGTTIEAEVQLSEQAV